MPSSSPTPSITGLKCSIFSNVHFLSKYTIASSCLLPLFMITFTLAKSKGCLDFGTSCYSRGFSGVGFDLLSSICVVGLGSCDFILTIPLFLSVCLLSAGSYFAAPCFCKVAMLLTSGYWDP